MAYVVKKGDNLTKIAKQNGLSLTKLLELNKQIKNPDYIQIGQKINLTNSSPTGKKIYDNNDGYPITPKNIPPSWNKVTKGAGNPTTSAKFKKPVKENKDEIIKYYIDEMIKSGNKKIFITDKGTKKTYYGNASDYNGDLKSLNSFDVLTGVNDDPNFYKYDDTSVDDIDKSQNPSIHKVTPIGKYSLIYDQIYNKPGFRLPNTSIAYHTIYPGELENRKSKLLSQTPNDNNVSYGCINCNEPDIQKVSKFLNSGDSTYIIDSRLPLDKLKSILNPKNNKSGKIETEKKSTNKVIDFFRNIFENGGYAASDNIDMGYYTNPIKYFAAMGINISDDNCLECGGKIKYPFGGYAEMGFDTNDYYSAIANERPRDSATSYQQDVKGKFNWLNTLAKTPIEQIQKDIDSIPLTKNYMLNKTPKGYFNVYDKNNKPVGYSIDGKTLVPQEPNFEDGGLVRAWIQKFMKGGYIAEGGYPNGQELTQPTTNYYNWGNYNNSFSDPTALNQNPFDVNKQQMQVPMAQSNMPQNIGTNYKMDFNASNDEVNKGNAMADSMMGGKNISKLNPVSLASNIADTTMQFGTDMIGAFAKPESKAAGFAQGAQKAGAATKSLDKIPFVNFFSKLIGGALGARTQGIKNEEMDKYNKIQEYNSRNSVAIGQPSYYGQTHSKYGSNIKNLEQRIIDDIFSDFDKYMKLT